MGRTVIRRHILRPHRIAHDARGDRCDLSRDHRVRRGARQIQVRGCRGERSLLAFRRPRLDVHLPAGVFDVRQNIGAIMSDHSEAVEHVGGTTITFSYVWIALLVMTGIEVFLAYEQLPTLIMLTALLGLSIIKAALII